LLEDVFERWCDRLGSSENAKDQLYALLCDRETRSRKRRVDTSGEETPETLSFLNAQFWQDLAHLLLMPDADGGDDHLVVNYTDHADVYLDVYFPDGHWEFSVRRSDVERWERLYPALAEPPPRPPAAQTAPDQPPEDKPGPDPVKTRAAERPSAGQSPQESLTSKDWLKGEVERRKKLGDIPVTITELSKQIHSEMEVAVRAGIVKRVIEPRTIETHVRDTTNLFPKKKRSPKS
jgi:hypothetical protein